MTTTMTLPRIGTVQQSRRGFLRSEWIKLRSARSTYWIGGIVAAMMLAMAITMALSVSGVVDGTAVASMATGGATGAQFATITLGAFVIAGEYRTGQIQSTFNADPTRVRTLTAKASVVAFATFLFALASSLVAFLVAHVLLLITGHAASSFLTVEGFRVLLGAPAYLAFTALLSLGFGAMFGRTAAAITAVMVLLWALPGSAVLLPGAWAANLVAFLPSSAGAALYASSFDAGSMDIMSAMTPGGGLQLAPWQGLLMVLVYLAIVGGIAARAIKRRDV